MNTIQHPEYLAYDNHAAWLQSHNKTLNRFEHKGVTIKQFHDGYYIDENYYPSKQAAIDFLDRKFAFNTFCDKFFYGCTRLQNILIYRGGQREIDQSDNFIKENSLPLKVTAFKDGFAIEFVKK